MIDVPTWRGDNQCAVIGTNHWQVERLFELTKKFKVMRIPLDHLYIYYLYDKLSLIEIVTHMKAANDADMSFPIILDEDGIIMDGRHRVMKAILNGEKTIKAVRFTKNPAPCKIEETV